MLPFFLNSCVEYRIRYVRGQAVVLKKGLLCLLYAYMGVCLVVCTGIVSIISLVEGCFLVLHAPTTAAIVLQIMRPEEAREPFAAFSY
jgi:hypothetical protein